jgi:Anthrone oxygenase
MLIRTLRFGVIMLTAISMATAFAHLLEMPAKLKFDSSKWLALLQTLYPPAFGPIGGVAEVGAVVGIVLLAFVVRRRRAAFRWTLLAAVCLISAHACFWILVAPVNAAMLPLTPETLPPDWTRLRDQWEYTHAARAVLQIMALGGLVVSLLVEIPTSRPEGEARDEVIQ